MSSTSSKPGAEPCPELWLCIRFTHLALNSLGIDYATNQAIAVSYQQSIWQSTALAAQSGITPAMSTNHALMLEPELLILERKVAEEELKLQELAYWAYRYSAVVSLYNDCCLLLEVGKSLKLFNGLNHLVHLIQSDLQSFTLKAELGVAKTPKAAYLFCLEPERLALSNPEANRLFTTNRHISSLKSVPIDYLELDKKIIAKLQHCGFECLADIMEIPTTELGSRFGLPFLDYWSRLLGHKADPQIATTPPEDFESCVDFSEPIHNVQWIEQQIQRLLNDLVNFTKTRHVVCRGFTWRFFHENNRLLKTVMVGVSGKQNNLETFYQLSLLKLESLKLEWEFSSIELSSKHFIPKTLFANDLFDPQTDNEEFNQLIDKLFNRLGRGALYRVNKQAEQLPELVNGLLPVNLDRGPPASSTAVRELPSQYADSPDKLAQDDVNTRNFKDEPLWLLEQPKRLAQHDTQPLLNGPLNLIHGPNRISSHWWSKLQSRDYYIARQTDGRLLWLYFDRGCRQWFLHGLFA